MKDQLVKVFKEKFGSEGDIRSYFAPGRVNLIGEHTDYNGGHVFPCALTIGTYAIVRKREDRNFRFYSTNFESLGGLTIHWGLYGHSLRKATRLTVVLICCYLEISRMVPDFPLLHP